MKKFMDENFLLNNNTGRELFFSQAAALPIIDYHCHVNAAEIAENKVFSSISEAWLGADHYKWRLMRANGVPEELVTGRGSEREKFFAFAGCLPKAAGNPIYHWAHMELERFFGYGGPLDKDTAGDVWELCNRALRDMPVRDMITRSKVECIITTDDPCDDLAAHRKIRAEQSSPGCDFGTRVLPGWRPDKAFDIENPAFCGYISRLGEVSGVGVRDLDSLVQALAARMDFFEDAGCVISDHGMAALPRAEGGEAAAGLALREALSGTRPERGGAEAFRFFLLKRLAAEYKRRGWAMQLHYAPIRNLNSLMFAAVGADAGFDSIGPAGNPVDIAGFFDACERDGALPKTIIYSLNPGDNACLAALIGCFQGSVPGRMQHGAAWWFNDTRSGIRAQLVNLAEQGLLGNFVGMLTDSRSFLSYVRHEYFRRILCDLLGGWVENGEFCAAGGHAEGIVRDVCYHNIRGFLQLG